MNVTATLQKRCERARHVVTAGLEPRQPRVVLFGARPTQIGRGTDAARHPSMSRRSAGWVCRCLVGETPFSLGSNLGHE